MVLMKLSLNLQKAINFASDKHSGQMRKADRIPYISHPFAVAWILAFYKADEDTVISGLLHDVLEDVPDCSEEEIQTLFGHRVLNIVKEVSENKDLNSGMDRKSSWQNRKQAYLDHLMEASESALLVCAADKIHNLTSHAQTFLAQGKDMWKNFSATPEKMLWYYEAVLKILKERFSHPIVEELKEKIEHFRKLACSPL
jgi:(p)ppGpp synthase/HD superfamily hydrolase